MKNGDTFQGKLGKYKIIETEDCDYTIYSEYFDENCHSLSGAFKETAHNFINAPEILRFSPSLNVLEVGLGAGIGLIATVRELNKIADKKRPFLTFISTEIDPELILFCQRRKDKASPYPHFSQLTSKTEDDLSYWACENSMGKLIVLEGDACQTIPRAHKLNLFKNVQVVYQDAFSPRKNPELWTNSFFQTLHNVCEEKAVLTTYSSSPSMRKRLEESGWTVENIEGFAKKKNATKAIRR